MNIFRRRPRRLERAKLVGKANLDPELAGLIGHYRAPDVVRHFLDRQHIALVVERLAGVRKGAERVR